MTRRFLLCLLAAACGENFRGNGSGDDAVIAHNVHVVDGDLAQQVTVLPDRLIFPYRTGAALLEREPGDVLVSGFGAGFLRKVVSVMRDGDHVIVTTTPGALTDAIVHGRVRRQLVLAPGDHVNGPGTGTLQAALDSGGGFGLDVGENGYLYFDPGSGASVTPSGRLDFHPSLDFDLDIDGGSLRSFELVAGGDFSASASVHAIAGEGATIAAGTTLWEAPPRVFVEFVGFVPVVMVLHLKVLGEVDVSAPDGIDVDFGATASTTVSAGVRYSGVGWEPVGEQSFSLDPIGPTLASDVGACVSFSLIPRVELMFYDVAGPVLEVGPYASLDIEATPPPPSWSASAGVSAAAAVELGILDRAFARYDVTLFDVSQEIASGRLADRCGDGTCGESETPESCAADCASSCGNGACDGDETAETCAADCPATPSCGNGACDAGETAASCPADCGSMPSCGNGACDGGESCSTCPADCGSCCGDGACSGGETCATCPADCGWAPADGGAGPRGCCGNGSCGGTETCGTCPADCGACGTVCGNGVCEGGESCTSCAADCGGCAPRCGDGACNGGESCGSCPGDCGSCGPVCGNGACEGGESCASCAADCGSCGGSSDNDRCSGATPILPGSTVSASTAGRANDDCPDGCSIGAGPDVWYTFTLGGPSMVLLSTWGSGFDTLLYLRSGSCSGPQVAINDDSCGTTQSALVAQLDAGTYFVAVDGWSASSSGDYGLRFEAGAASCSGRFSPAPFAFDGTSLPLGGNTCDGGSSASSATCGGSATEQFWTFYACPGSMITASTCGMGASWDTVLYARSGGCDGAEVACADDSCGTQSTIMFSTTGGLYTLVVDGFGTACGSYTATLTR